MWSLHHDGGTYRFERVSVTSVQIEGRTYRVDDTPNPRSDGVGFGQDFADPGDVKLRLLINFQHVRNVALQRAMLQEAADSFLWAWDAARTRLISSSVAEFVVPSLGAFEGRPRRAEWDWATFGLGYLVGTASFVRSSNGVFALDEAGELSWRSVETQLVPPQPRSGWVFPLVFPVQNLEPAVKASWFEVAGDTDTPCVVEIQGPIQAGAEVEVPGGWRVRTRRDLAYDELAVVDARPGRALLTVNGVPTNFLTPDSSLLSELTLSPGPHQLSFRGVSPQGTASVRVRWRDMKAGI